MLTDRPITHSKSYSIFVALVILSLVLAGCGLPLTTAHTPIPPSPTSLVPMATQAPVSAGAGTPQVVLATPTSNPGIPSDQAVETPTSVIAIPTEVVPGPTAESTSLPVYNPLPTSAVSIPTGSIAFTPGTTATVAQGTIAPGQILTYTLGATQLQSMVLIMDAPNKDVTLGVFNPDGSTLLDPYSKWTTWQGVLPQTGLYKIQLTGGATTENFALTIKVARLVNFAAGASSASLNGTTVNGYMFDYGLYCSAGQLMTVSLNVPATTAYLDIFGISTGTLLWDSARANTWTGILPQTEQYVIEVVPANAQVVNYSLTVSVGPATGNPPAPQGDIVIAPGSTAAVKQGVVNPGQVVTYTIEANQYQPMILILESDRNDVFLGVVAPDGTDMLSPSKQWTYWQWRLPQTGLYTIQVSGGATTEKYTLTAKLPRMTSFAPGTSTITIKSATEQGYIVSYSFRLSFGQTLIVSLDVPSSVAYLSIYGLTTGSLLDYTAKRNYWKGVLPESQEYIIDVIPRGGGIQQYHLTVSVQ